MWEEDDLKFIDAYKEEIDKYQQNPSHFFSLALDNKFIPVRAKVAIVIERLLWPSSPFVIDSEQVNGYTILRLYGPSGQKLMIFRSYYPNQKKGEICEYWYHNIITTLAMNYGLPGDFLAKLPIVMREYMNKGVFTGFDGIDLGG